MAKTALTVQAALALATEAGMPEYVGVARANQAWLAWMRGDARAVERECQAALDVWRTGHNYAAPWIAHLTLLASRVNRRDFSGALACASAIMQPDRQRPRVEVTQHLEAAVAAGRKDLARVTSELDKAVAAAKDVWFL